MCLSKWKKISDCLEDAAKEKRFQGTKTSLKPLIKHLPPQKNPLLIYKVYCIDYIN